VVATEYLTRFAVAKPLPTKDAAAVADFIFNDIICMFGIPKILQHDQGREFCNNIEGYICDRLNVKEPISTAYHPQTNGLTERFNQTLVTQLMKLEEAIDWDSHVQPILFAYRVSMQASLKKSPYEMLFGAKPRLPIDMKYPTTEGADPSADLQGAIARRMMAISQELPKLRDQGLQNLAKAQEQQKRHYDAKHVGTYYDIGDLVSILT